MKLRKNISIIMAGILMSFVSFGSINVSAVEENVATEVPTLTATANNEGNFVHLDWSKWTAPNDKEYLYRVFSKRSDEKEFQSIPAKEKVKVLNVYPGTTEGDENRKDEDKQENRGNNLKAWMNEPAKKLDSNNNYVYIKDKDGNFITNSRGIVEKDKDGNPSKDKDGNYICSTPGLIEVDSVRIGANDGKELGSFNADPEAWLKYENKKSKYDVIMFGSWDSNNEKDLSNNAADKVEEFIKQGGGVLFGHDTIRSEVPNRNFAKRFLSYLNMSLNNDYWKGKQPNSNEPLHGGGTAIRVSKNGLLTNYPWNIGGIGTSLVIPDTHDVGQLPGGDQWLKFSNIKNDNHPCNFYLTTWNNVAMIQTGHSNGEATPDEEKILANTLFYLAQVTENTSWDDHKGQDVAPPTTPEFNYVNLDKNNGKVNIGFTKAEDNGSTYNYYVEATEKVGKNEAENKIREKLFIPEGADKDEKKSVSATVTTGLKGYSVVVDKNPDTKLDGKNTIADNTCVVDVDFDSDFYVHVAAVDNAGNVSETATYAYPTLELTKGEVENNEVKITAKVNKSVAKIILPNGEVVDVKDAEEPKEAYFTAKANGEYTFSAIDEYWNRVTKSVIVNNFETNVKLDLNDDGDHAVLNWSVADKSQNYTYNLYSKKSSEKDYKVTSLNDTFYDAVDDKDISAPFEVEIDKVDIDKENNKVIVKYNTVSDDSTSYDYYVEAVSTETGIKSTSSVKTAKLMSGLKGYSVIIDKNPDTIPDASIITTSNEWTFENIPDDNFYVHVAAVDNAGNISKVSTKQYVYSKILDIRCEGDKIEKGKYLYVDVMLDNINELNKSFKINKFNDLLNQNISLKYDKSFLKYLGIRSINEHMLLDIHKNDGILNLNMSGENDNLINEETNLVTLKFAVLDTGESELSIVEGIFSNIYGQKNVLLPGEMGSVKLKVD